MADALPLSQDEHAKLTTPLGANVLALAKLVAAERLSELFEFRIDAVSHEAYLDFATTLQTELDRGAEDAGRSDPLFQRRDDGGALVGNRRQAHTRARRRQVEPQTSPRSFVAPL